MRVELLQETMLGRESLVWILVDREQKWSPFGENSFGSVQLSRFVEDFDWYTPHCDGLDSLVGYVLNL